MLPPLVSKKFSEIQEQYKSENRSLLRALIYGKMGSGKTRLAKTCRLPVLLHSFDNAGTQTISEEIEKGHIIADTRFEGEDLLHPKMIELWLSEMRALEKINAFQNIGTFVLDSTTTWADAFIAKILKDEGKRSMEIQNWGQLFTQITVCTRMLVNLPCDVVVLGHVGVDKDEVTGRMTNSLLIQGQSKDKMPLLFSEIYYLDTKESSKGLERSLLTANNGSYIARTRIGREGRFEKFEAPNISYLLKKAGMPEGHLEPFSDLPFILESPEVSRYGKQQQKGESMNRKSV